jgi:hypothetical protein
VIKDGAASLVLLGRGQGRAGGRSRLGEFARAQFALSGDCFACRFDSDVVLYPINFKSYSNGLQFSSQNLIVRVSIYMMHYASRYVTRKAMKRALTKI